MTYSSGGFDWTSLRLHRWLSIFHFPTLLPCSIFVQRVWSLSSPFPSLCSLTPPCSPFILECSNWSDVTDYIHSAPLSWAWLCESEGFWPIVNWWWETAWLWLSSIMDPEGNGVVMILVRLPPAFLWGPHYAFTALRDYFGEPNSSAPSEKLWFSAAQKVAKMLYITPVLFECGAPNCECKCGDHSLKWTRWTLNDFFLRDSLYFP